MTTCRPCKGGKRLSPRERAEARRIERDRQEKAAAAQARAESIVRNTGK